MESSTGEYKVLLIFGTRPEAIKMAPLIRSIGKRDGYDVVVVNTGQHLEMLDQVTACFEIKPDYDLTVMKPGQSLNLILAQIVSKLDSILQKEKPDLVVVQGDTTTALAGAIASFYREVPVCHLEAGLRTGDIKSPFPEEANRKIIAQIAALHFAPTTTARDCLLKEMVDPSTVVVTGNTVIDALLIATGWSPEITDPRVKKALDSPARKILVTSHRRENIQAMEQIGRAIQKIAKANPGIEIIFPAHMSPAVQTRLVPILSDEPNVVVTRPLAYDEFVAVMNSSDLILTDSGGIQEEAPSLGVPVLVMRNDTERTEAVEAGTAILVGPVADNIAYYTQKLLEDEAFYKSMARATNPYGNGTAAEKACLAIDTFLRSAANQTQQ